MAVATDRPHPRWQTAPRRRATIPILALIPLLALGMILASATLSFWGGTGSSTVLPGPAESPTPPSAWSWSGTSTIPPTQTPYLIPIDRPVYIIVTPTHGTYLTPVPRPPVPATWAAPTPTMVPTATPLPTWRWGG